MSQVTSISSKTSIAHPSRCATADAGVLWMASGPGRVQRGDVVAVVMNDYDDAIGCRMRRQGAVAGHELHADRRTHRRPENHRTEQGEGSTP